MVKIEIITLGKDKSEWLTAGAAHFEKLLSKYAKIKWTVLSPSKESTALSAGEIKKQESGLLQKHLGEGTIIALADSGKKFDSVSFAKQLEKILSQSSGALKFVIGGPFGLDESILKKADFVISLSSLTFSHQIVRIILMEQLYRAFSILHNTDYHK